MGRATGWACPPSPRVSRSALARGRGGAFGGLALPAFAKRILLDLGRREGWVFRAQARELRSQPAVVSPGHERAPHPLPLAGGSRRDFGLYAGTSRRRRSPPPGA